jgi:hypothetical protein
LWPLHCSFSLVVDLLDVMSSLGRKASHCHAAQGLPKMGP